MFPVTDIGGSCAETGLARDCQALVELREILLPELAGDTAACGAAGRFGGAQLDAAGLARDGLGQLGEFEAADTLLGRQELSEGLGNGERGPAGRGPVRGP